MTTSAKAARYTNLHTYCAETGTKKVFIANRLGVSRFQLAGLLYPERYSVLLTDTLVTRLAELLNQPTQHVRKLYERAA